MHHLDALFYALQSKCLKRQVGCVVVKHDRIVSYGFNHGYMEECGCNPTKGIKNPHALHAEQMALQGTDEDIYIGADMYIPYQPCMDCARLIVEKGLASVHYLRESDLTEAVEYLESNGVRTYHSKDDKYDVYLNSLRGDYKSYSHNSLQPMDTVDEHSRQRTISS